MKLQLAPGVRQSATAEVHRMPGPRDSLHGTAQASMRRMSSIGTKKKINKFSNTLMLTEQHRRLKIRTLHKRMYRLQTQVKIPRRLILRDDHCTSVHSVLSAEATCDMTASLAYNNRTEFPSRQQWWRWDASSALSPCWRCAG